MRIGKTEAGTGSLNLIHCLGILKAFFVNKYENKSILDG
jgi:hypothetical protein